MSTTTVYRARRVLVGLHALVQDGGLEVRAGQIVRVLRGRAALRRAGGRGGTRVVDVGPGLLAPGFVDAHAHLDLSGLEGRLPRSTSFPDWIRALIACRRARASADLARDWRAGADRLLASGTTLVGDIDSTGAIEAGGLRHPLRVRRFVEVLDGGDPARAPAALERFHARRTRAPRRYPGVSPHAPYTVSAPLWRALAEHARRGPVAIHFAETPEEREWLSHGRGPFAALLAHPPRVDGLAAIERAGFLSTRTALIHANHVTPDERARIACSGATVVHCPGTHAFFGRPPFDAEAWVRSGAPLALGTDSLASNDALDMRREMRLARDAHAGLAPEIAFAGATTAAARALGCAGRAGVLSPGAWADFVLHDVEPTTARAALEALTSGEIAVRGVWVAGQRAVGGM